MQPIPEPTKVVVENATAAKKLTALGLTIINNGGRLYLLGIERFLTFPCTVIMRQFGEFATFETQGRQTFVHRRIAITALTGPVKCFFRNVVFTDAECIIVNGIRSVMFMRGEECKTTQTACGLELSSLVRGELRPRIQGSVLIYGHNVARLATLIHVARRGKFPLTRDLLIEIVRHIDLGDVRI